MGSLTFKDSPVSVGKVTISSTFLGTRKNGDIVIDVCTRFSYPDLYNRQYTSAYPDTPSQRIDISATSEDVVNACCDLYKISNQDLEFHMQLVLKNYDAIDGKQCSEESTVPADVGTIQDHIDVKTNRKIRVYEKLQVLQEERYSDQPYLFASCENDDNDETIATFETIVSDEDDSDPLEISNRENQIRGPGFNTISPVDLCDNLVEEDIVVKPEPEMEIENPSEPDKRANIPKPKIKVPQALAKTEGEIYGFEDIRIENIKRTKAKTRCVFCNADVNHFSRHLVRKHGDEKEVKAFSSLPKECRKRSILIGIIRKRGNFTKISDNIIAPVRRPREGKDGLCFMACPYCKGIYSARYVRRHFSRCHLNKDRRVKA